MEMPQHKHLLALLIFIALSNDIMEQAHVHYSWSGSAEYNSYLKGNHFYHKFKGLKHGKISKTILIYTSLFSSPEWPNVKASEGDKLLGKFGCPVTNCRLRYKSETDGLDGADIVVFHDRDMPSGSLLRQLSETERPKNQIWVYFTGESPLNSHHDISFLDDVFDWTMTYKHSSDIWVPYSRYHHNYIKSGKKVKENRLNHAKTKTKLIAWIASDCEKIRDRIVYELDKLVPVDVAGECSKYFSNEFSCDDEHSCQSKLKDYKFYLAFENGFCEDYVTEKYWYKGIRSGVVPVVLGGGPYNDPHVAIPGSYINVLDFKTIGDLAKYLKYLDKNDTAYNEYFSWKKKYKLWEPVCDWPFEPYWACEMCLRLNKGIKLAKRIKMSEFWSVSKNCKGLEDEAKTLLENSGHDFSNFPKMKLAVENPFNEVSKEIDYEEENSRDHGREKTEKEDSIFKNEDDHELKSIESRMLFLKQSDNSDYTLIILFSFSIISIMLYIFRRRQLQRI